MPEWRGSIAVNRIGWLQRGHKNGSKRRWLFRPSPCELAALIALLVKRLAGEISSRFGGVIRIAASKARASFLVPKDRRSDTGQSELDSH